MKHILPLTIVLFMFNCKSSLKKEVQTESKSIVITSNQVEDIVSYLASDELQGRKTGTEGIEKAATYIEKQFESYGIKPYFETFRDNFKAKEVDAFNVVGFIEGTDSVLKNEVIILGAHYDHIGFGKKEENDSIANGANDDASGTSAVMAMANYFSKKKNNKRSIMFALFSAEEMGLLGSKHLAKRLKNEDLNLYTAITIEMIGVPLINTEHQAFITGYELSNMAEKMNDYVGSNFIGQSEVAVKYRLFRRSDNYPFYQEFNAPSQSISSCDLTNFDHYHKVGDEADKMDYDFMAGLINKMIPAIEKMSNSPTKEIVMYEE